jgi:hypothetical protein
MRKVSKSNVLVLIAPSDSAKSRFSRNSFNTHEIVSSEPCWRTACTGDGGSPGQP